MRAGGWTGRWLVGAALGLALPMGSIAQAEDKPASAYVQCDGQPNNVTAGETAARLLGAVTLLGLFAPAPEGADPAKRRFGAEGVAVCTTLIDGEKREGNGERRIALILARAIHRIEAKDYDAAIADAGLARSEAKAAGLLDNPYYARSRGLAFDWIAGTALLRKGQVGAARDSLLAPLPAIDHSAFGLILVPDYMPWQREATPAELTYLDRRTHMMPTTADEHAARLEELGRFADAARLREAMVDFDRALMPARPPSLPIARAAVTLQLAGERDRAAARAAEARANFDKRQATGKPETNAGSYVETMDLYAILAAADAGQMDKARRLFAARSQWTAASLGAVMEANRRLRAGAPAADLIGGLESDPDRLWHDRATARTAAVQATDADNRTLFGLVPGAIGAGAYESVAKNVWRTDKSKLLLTPSKTDKTEEPRSPYETLFLYGVATPVAIDAYTLHAALLAKARGHQGFVLLPFSGNGIVAARMLTGARGSPGLPDALFNDADATIAALSPLIPSPEVLKARADARAKADQRQRTNDKTS